MKKWRRFILFWGLTILFLLTAPTVIFSARGYRFDFSRGVFVHSGTITFKSNPQDLQISLNGKSYSSKVNMINNSSNISGLLPRRYDVVVSAPGFSSWSKSADVHSGVATEFWNVLLVRENYERQKNNAIGIGKFFMSGSGSSLAYTADTAQGFSVRILDTNQKKETVSFDFPDWKFIDKKTENIEWSTNTKMLSVPVKKESADPSASPEFAYFIIDISSQESFNLNEFLKKDNISNVRWDPAEKNYLIFLEGDNLYRVNINDPSDLVLLAEGISAFNLSGGNVFYTLFSSNLIFKKSTAAQTDPVQITSAFPGSTDMPISNIIVYDDSRIAIFLDNQELYVFNKGEHSDYFQRLDSAVQDARFSDDGKKLLFWSDNQISVYYLRDEISQPVREENTKQDITRYSEALNNVQWFSDYEHIIFSVGNTVKIIELDPRDKKNSMDIVEVDLEKSLAIYSERLKKLFFTDRSGDSSELFSIDFPEKVSVLQAVGL